MKKSRVYALFVSSFLTLSSCGKDVDCDIADEHVHFYQTYSGIERLIEGEKEYRGEYYRQDEYVLMDAYYKIIVENNLCILDDNISYVEKRFEERPELKRWELVKELIPAHYGLRYESGKEGLESLSYGLIEDQYKTSWQEIPLDQYTKNPVKDESYGLLLYKIQEDGTLESKVFLDWDSIEDGYDYFKTADLITKVVSDEYYLEKQDNKKKSY